MAGNSNFYLRPAYIKSTTHYCLTRVLSLARTGFNAAPRTVATAKLANVDPVRPRRTRDSNIFFFQSLRPLRRGTATPCASKHQRANQPRHQAWAPSRKVPRKVSSIKQCQQGGTRRHWHLHRVRHAKHGCASLSSANGGWRGGDDKSRLVSLGAFSYLAQSTRSSEGC
jgi:hypothetical protein